jgi:protein-S-isoprenylcysteine O-methyltransferase Ste14
VAFYAVAHQLALAIMLSMEVIAARLLENTATGTKTVARQSWMGLFAIVWVGMNIALAWSARVQFARLPGASLAMAWCGVTLFTLALALRIWSAWTLGDFFSLHVTIFKNHRLVIAGPYRYCRHPAYLGSVLQIIGLTLAFQTLVGMMVLVFFIPLLFWRMRDEEQLLGDAFQEAYAAYQRKVPMLFPFSR